jgi:hypothetical protein
MSDFIVDELGPDGLFGVFEDDGETGYLYLYEPDGQGVTKHLQIYNCAKKLNVQEEDVKVAWTEDGGKCGVIIWNGMRGIIDLRHDEEMSVKIESPGSPLISDPEWLKGFEEL